MTDGDRFVDQDAVPEGDEHAGGFQRGKTGFAGRITFWHIGFLLTKKSAPAAKGKNAGAADGCGTL